MLGRRILFAVPLLGVIVAWFSSTPAVLSLPAGLVAMFIIRRLRHSRPSHLTRLPLAAAPCVVRAVRLSAHRFGFCTLTFEFEYGSA